MLSDQAGWRYRHSILDKSRHVLGLRPQHSRLRSYDAAFAVLVLVGKSSKLMESIVTLSSIAFSAKLAS